MIPDNKTAPDLIPREFCQHRSSRVPNGEILEEMPPPPEWKDWYLVRNLSGRLSAGPSLTSFYCNQGSQGTLEHRMFLFRKGYLGYVVLSPTLNANVSNCLYKFTMWTYGLWAWPPILGFIINRDLFLPLGGVTVTLTNLKPRTISTGGTHGGWFLSFHHSTANDFRFRGIKKDEGENPQQNVRS
ncbi:hypothetical protein CEXT_416751 [Caerostris extrusa]|uniref:Uncharacterized protein n=1 Tax=Caerostris extrusa TaxID=172846 RepID=A0AAV4V6G0_CAEEX|nr:hypothetical protein CEXT_416751 [Caerostris extrusa]